MQKIKIAFIDDNEALLDSFQASYDNDKYEIHTFKSLDTAIITIDESFFSFHFVILDGKGYLEYTETGHGTEWFAIKAREKINNLIKKYQRDMPYCYFTAYSDEAIMQGITSISEDEDIRVFNKKEAGDEALMFEYIDTRYSKLEETSIRKRFPDIFKIFDLEYLDSSSERDLILLISSSNNLTDVNSKQFSRNIRPFLECICKNMSIINRKFLSPNFKQGDEQSLSDSIWFLAGKPRWNRMVKNYEFDSTQFMPIHLFEMISALQKATSKTAMHDYSISINRYTALSYLYTLLDFMLWFKETVQDNK